MFFFKQKTAYEMRISDWSSDVCSSDLPALARQGRILGERLSCRPCVRSRSRYASSERRRPRSVRIMCPCRMPPSARSGWCRRTPRRLRSDERRVGKECVSKCSSRCAPYHKTTKTKDEELEDVSTNHRKKKC